MFSNTENGLRVDSKVCLVLAQVFSVPQPSVWNIFRATQPTFWAGAGSVQLNPGFSLFGRGKRSQTQLYSVSGTRSDFFRAPPDSELQFGALYGQLNRLSGPGLA